MDDNIKLFITEIESEKHQESVVEAVNMQHLNTKIIQSKSNLQKYRPIPHIKQQKIPVRMGLIFS